MDHLVAKVQHACAQPISMGEMRHRRTGPVIGLHSGWPGRGPAATNMFEAGAFLRSKRGATYPDLMLGFAPVAMQFETTARRGHGYQLHMAGMRLEAPAPWRSRSPDPHRPPAILLNYLSTEADRQFWVDALRIARELLAQPAFGGLDAGEVCPGDRRRPDSDEDVVRLDRRTGETGMHPTSTCRMGTAPWSVVDPSTMRVHGLDGCAWSTRR